MYGSMMNCVYMYVFVGNGTRCQEGLLEEKTFDLLDSKTVG